MIFLCMFREFSKGIHIFKHFPDHSVLALLGLLV
jgi:hypothetical protein